MDTCTCFKFQMLLIVIRLGDRGLRLGEGGGVTWGSMEPSQPEVGTKVKKGKTRMEVPTERKREKAAGQMPVMMREALGSRGGSASSFSRSLACGDTGQPSMLPIEAALSAKNPAQQTVIESHWHAATLATPACYLSKLPSLHSPCTPGHSRVATPATPACCLSKPPSLQKSLHTSQLHVAIRASLACCLPQSPSLQSPSTWDMFVSDLLRAKQAVLPSLALCSRRVTLAWH